MVNIFSWSLSAWVILSVWMGYFFRLHPILLLISFFCGWKITKILDVETKTKQPREYTYWILLLCLFVIISASYIFFGIQKGFDLSADATPSVAAHYIQAKIPHTFFPDFDLLFLYQVGLPVLVSQLAWTGISIHTLGWGLGLLGIVLALIYFSEWTFYVTQSSAAAVLSVIFLAASRLMGLNLLVGEYPWLLSLGIGLFAMVQLTYAGKWGILPLVASWMVHPYIGGMCFLAWLLWGLWERSSYSLHKLAQIVFGFGALVFPIIIFQILPTILSPKNILPVSLSFSASTFLGIFSLIGALGFTVFVLGLVAHHLLVRNTVSRLGLDAVEKYLLSLFELSMAGYIIFSYFPVTFAASKWLQLGVLATAMGAAYSLSRLFSRRVVVGLVIVLLLAGAWLFFSSSDVKRLIGGSKISVDAATFAQAYGKFDPVRSRVLFVNQYAGKLAQYSNKIPTDVISGNYILPVRILDTETSRELVRQSMETQMVLEKKCVECVDEFDANYVVANTREFGTLSKPVIFSYGDWVVYRLG